MLAECPAGFVVVELTAGNVDAVLSRMARLRAGFPACPGGRGGRAEHGELRVADARGRGGRFRHLAAPAGAAGRLACRHLAQVPAGRRALTERIWSSLPWARSE